jgi:pimeloyl-ACP methyl ester carboxylesterase
MGTLQIEANGVSFSCLESGSGPLVLCFHGFPDTAHTWDALLPRLAAAGYRAVAPFMRGYHPSGAPRDGDYSALRLGEDVIALIDALGEKSAMVIGHDWGALASYVAASLAPEKISKLVISAIPHPRALGWSPRFFFRARHFFYLPLPIIGARSMSANDFEGIRRLSIDWSPSWRPTVEDLAPVKRCFSAPGSLAAALGYYRAFVLGIFKPSGFRLRRLLFARKTMPCLCFGGMEDGIATPDMFARSRPYFTGTFELEMIERAGHFLHREAPDRFASRIIAFLASGTVSRATG